MTHIEQVVHSRTLREDQSGELIDLPREAAGWEWMSFFVRRLTPGMAWDYRAQKEEVALILLGGQCITDWGQGKQLIGGRRDVFHGFPHALYLPPGTRASVKAETICEIGECRVPSTTRLEPKLITPKDVSSSLRGGENASRQIVDIIRPDFPADRLIVVEVYTPGGNWSSYPPHKHDVHNPPTEVDLDEIYYYRMQPGGFALQHLYGGEDKGERTLKARDGDAILVHSGYHSVVAGPGYDVYYLNFLAGSARALSVTEDKQHAWIRSSWNGTDPRVPMVRD